MKSFMRCMRSATDVRRLGAGVAPLFSVWLRVTSKFSHAVPGQFADVLLGNQSPKGIRQFWDHVTSLDPWKHVGSKFAVEDFGRLVPISLHCDGAEMFRDQEYMVWSWSSLFHGESKGDPLLTKYTICVVAEAEMSDEHATCAETVSLHLALLLFAPLTFGGSCGGARRSGEGGDVVAPACGFGTRS